MKKIFVLTALICISSALYTQTPPVNIQRDTLPNGSILITVQPEGGLWSKYIQLPDNYGTTTFNFTYNTDNTGLSETGEDYLISNLYSPDNYGGCLPLDVCYNSIQNKLYFYGGQNIIVVDALTNSKIKEIRVSETFTHTYASFINRKESHYLMYNPQYNKVFCATLSADLVIIDCNTDEIVNVINSPDIFNFHSTSLAMDAYGDFLYWYVNDTFSFKYLNKVDCQTNNRVLQRGFDQGIYDIVCDYDDPIIYLSTFCHPASKIYSIYTINLETITLFGQAEIGKMVVNETTNMLYVDDLLSSRVLAYDLNTYAQVDAIDVSFNYLSQGTCNSTEDFIYFTGFDDITGSEGLIIINGSLGQEVKVYPGDPFTIGLLYDNNMDVVFFSCSDKITAIDGTNYNHVHDFATNEGGKSMRLISGQGQSVISANLNEGTATVFDLQSTSHGKQLVLNSLIQLGGNMVFGCYNEVNEKVYYMQYSSTNRQSYLSIFNANTLSNIAEIQISPSLLDIKYNEHNNRVYLLLNVDKKIIPIDGESNQILANEIINLPSEPADIFFSSGNKIYVACDYYIYIIDGNTHQTLNTILAPGGKKFEENTNSHIIYASQNGWYNITAIDAITNQKIADIALSGLNVSDMCYDVSDNNVFVSYSDVNNIDVISGTSITSTISTADIVTFLEYNYLENKVYALSEYSLSVINHNSIIKTIGLSGYCEGLLYNNINNKIYCHMLFDSIDFYSKIIAIDCTTDEICSVVHLPQKQQPGVCIITRKNGLVFSENNNRIFCGTRAFSSICAVQCNTERLPLQNGWNWISFPRLERSDNNTAPSIPVLKRINYYPELMLELTENNNGDPYLEYINYVWSGDLTEVRSTSGYKLELDITGENLAPEIDLYGMQIDPETEMSLYPGQENWVGYFVDYPQMPFDCFDATTWDNLTLIKTQDWAMVKGETAWWIKGRVVPFEYGDLVILKTEAYQTFQWVYGEESESEGMPRTNFYSYEEQADYLPVYVVFDATSDVQEVAVTVEGEIKGAAVRESGDTIVGIKAYLDDTPPGATLEFETWDGFKSSEVKKEEYIVYNSLQREMERRRIYAGEKTNFQLISFKQGEVFSVPGSISDVCCLPNPFSNNTNISFRLNETSHISVEIFDINGKKINTLLEGELPVGKYNTTWQCNRENGSRANKGVYFYRIRSTIGKEIRDKIVLL